MDHDGVPFPYKFPINVHILDITCQQWIKSGTPNLRNEFSYICLVRVAFAKLFPDLERILSMDADTIITQDISGLWDLDMTDYYLAGVPEVKLSAQQGRPYINAGMMLFNLDKIRQDGKDDQMIDDINRTYFQWVEQDCINKNLAGGILTLGSEYNASQFSAPCENPKIWHFAYTQGWQNKDIVKQYREGQA